jgi:hypothetical protein
MIASTRPILIIELNDDLLREVGRPKEVVVTSLRDQGYRICTLESKKTKERRNLNNPLSPEILCLPSERIEEYRETLSRLHIESWSDS